MSKTLRILSASALAFCLALPVSAEQDMTSESVVATVNGTEITLGHMLVARAALPEQYRQLPDTVLWEGILDQLIQQQILADDPLAVETPTLMKALENEKRSLLAAEAITAIAEQAASDEAIQAQYEAEFLNGGAQALEFNASHILVETEEEAIAIAEEARNGADFAELAKEKSTGPSGPNGGSLGWFSRGMMVEDFQAAIEALDPETVSDPVETQFGWHVIRLNETRAKEAPSLDQVRAEIEQKLQQDAVSAYLDQAVAGADITRTQPDEVDTSILSNASLLD